MTQATHAFPDICQDAVTVSLLADFDASDVRSLLARYGLKLTLVHKKRAIPGSYWGDSEAGLVGNELLARIDTPIHSILHEACHYVCMDPQRRNGLDTDAGGDYDEENGVCYLQIRLAGELESFSSEQMMNDMDAWGYTFRLGSARAWFRQDAQDALGWLQAHGILDDNARPSWAVRTAR